MLALRAPINQQVQAGPKLSGMMRAIGLLVVLAGPLGGQTLNWHNAVLDSLADSYGDPLSNEFTVELGTFADGFTPAEANVDDWMENWLVFDQADFNPTLGYFSGVADMQPDGTSDSLAMTPGAPSFENDAAFIWIRKGDVALAMSEWLLVSDPDWVFPMADSECCANREPVEWAVSDLDPFDVPEWGNQGGTLGPGEYTVTGSYVLQTHTFVVVPEPSKMAGLMVMACLGLLRRTRNGGRR